MKNSFLTGMILLFACCSMSAQIAKKMKLVPGGQYTMGGGYMYEVDDKSMYYLGESPKLDQMNQKGIPIGEMPEPNNPTELVTVEPFYISETEVTNFEYRDFLIHVLYGEKQARAIYKELAKGQTDTRVIWNRIFAKADAEGLLPDTSCWQEDFTKVYNHPLVSHYFTHPAFNNYPVVGVSWEQARAYCRYVTKAINEERVEKGQAPLPPFRLPNEAEWEWAAKGAKTKVDQEMSVNQQQFPWPDNKLWDRNGQYRANIKTGWENYIGDGFEYAAPVSSFKANSLGLYNMAGNVAEWTEDVFPLVSLDDKEMQKSGYRQTNPDASAYRIVKGGSWADYYLAAMTGSRGRYERNRGYSRVGFRIARSKAE